MAFWSVWNFAPPLPLILDTQDPLPQNYELTIPLPPYPQSYELFSGLPQLLCFYGGWNSPKGFLIMWSGEQCYGYVTSVVAKVKAGCPGVQRRIPEVCMLQCIRWVMIDIPGACRSAHLPSVCSIALLTADELCGSCLYTSQSWLLTSVLSDGASRKVCCIFSAWSHRRNGKKVHCNL